MGEPIQVSLNRRLKQCRHDERGLVLCGYHHDRLACTAFKIDQSVTGGARTAILRPTRDVRELARLFQTGSSPAGSWYLVREQREWLESRLEEILTEHRSTGTIRILEAGAASFVHHYGFLSILETVLRRLPAAPRVDLTLVDKCLAPVLQVDAVEALLAEGLRRPRRWTPFKARSVTRLGMTLNIDRRFAEMMNTRRRSFARISCDLRTLDLRHVGSIRALGQFHLITEHFLTSVLDRFMPDIRAVRQTYAAVLVPGGHLLCASGLTSRARSYQQYQQLHEELGLHSVAEHTRACWDPYGLETQAILDLSEAVAVAKDNTLTDYVKS